MTGDPMAYAMHGGDFGLTGGAAGLVANGPASSSRDWPAG
jgi:hypothetical protein